MTIYPDRGDGRKVHYGEGKQPLDTIAELDWEPEFLAGNILKYLRRSKDPEHSLESARFYYKRLHAIAMKQTPQRASHILWQLLRELSNEEQERIR